MEDSQVQDTVTLPLDDLAALIVQTVKAAAADGIAAGAKFMAETAPAMRQEYAEERVSDLVAKLDWLIGHIGWSEDGTFTFPDGETFYRDEGDQPVTRVSPWLNADDN